MTGIPDTPSSSPIETEPDRQLTDRWETSLSEWIDRPLTDNFTIESVMIKQETCKEP